jgi:hypothetical protein
VATASPFRSTELGAIFATVASQSQEEIGRKKAQNAQKMTAPKGAFGGLQTSSSIIDLLI